MNPLNLLYKNGLEALSHGDFENYLSSLVGLSDIREKRIVSHLGVKKLMAEGQYEFALKEIAQVKESFGEHISLVCDQACLYYALEDYWHWDAAVAHLEKTFINVRCLLDEESRFKTGLLLSKFFEEQGLIRKSIAQLMALKKSISPKSLQFQARITANLTRILATHDFSDELMSAYKDLKYLVESNLDFKVDVEIIYALILSEARFFASTKNNNAWKSTYKKYLLENDNLLQEEKSQILFDLLQLKQEGINIDLNEYESEINFLTAHTEYERKLLGIVKSSEADLADWPLWSSQMPLGNYLMLASLLRRKLPSDELSQLEKQVAMLVYAFDDANKNFWISKFTSIESEKNQVSISLTDFALFVGTEAKDRVITIQFNSKKTLFRLILALAEDPKDARVSLPELNQKLFNCEIDESSFHRIREQVRRINSEFKLINLPVFIQIKGGKVEVLKNYSLRF